MKKFHLKPTIFCSKIPKNSRKTDCYNNNIEKIEESNGNGLKKNDWNLLCKVYIL